MNEHDLTCKEMVELVTDYLENKLSPPQHVQFENHLSKCAGCTNYVEQMRTTIQLVGRLSETDISPEAERRLLALFREWKRTRTTD